jgi:7-keto-8-aminopelargonate synthetase-like enzyme
LPCHSQWPGTHTRAGCAAGAIAAGTSTTVDAAMRTATVVCAAALPLAAMSAHAAIHLMLILTSVRCANVEPRS